MGLSYSNLGDNHEKTVKINELGVILKRYANRQNR